MDPATTIALGGLSLAAVGGLWKGVQALWKIASSVGLYQGQTTTILNGMQTILGDHETRIRTLEKDS